MSQGQIPTSADDRASTPTAHTPPRRRMAQLIPEFPGQTHIFFWREIQALAAFGVDCTLVSTSRPSASIVCHDWSREAMTRTTYLFPPNAPDLWSASREMLTAGPKAWKRCLGVLIARGVGGVRERAKLVGLMVMGARLAALARAQGWSHVHSQSCGDSAYIAVFASMLGRVTYSMNLHGAVEYFGLGQDIKWAHAAFAAAVTQTLKDDVLRRVSTAVAERIDLAPMGVDLSVFERTKPYEPAGMEMTGETAEPVRLVTCSRLHVGKGQQDVIRAVAILRDRGVPVRFTILGEGPARELLTALIVELGLEAQVTLMGAVPERSVREALENSHVFCLASHEEALGVATMEAMAMGIPVVVSKVGGVHELVRDGVDGVMVPPERPDAIADAIEVIARDAPRAARMGASGRDRVHTMFGSDRSARVIEARLRQVHGSAMKGSRAE